MNFPLTVWQQWITSRVFMRNRDVSTPASDSLGCQTPSPLYTLGCKEQCLLPLQYTTLTLIAPSSQLCTWNSTLSVALRAQDAIYIDFSATGPKPTSSLAPGREVYETSRWPNFFPQQMADPGSCWPNAKGCTNAPPVLRANQIVQLCQGLS